MKLTISQIDKMLWKGDAVSVTIPGADGEMTVMGDHMPLVSTLREGVIIVRGSNGEEQSYPVKTGFLEIGREETVILL